MISRSKVISFECQRSGTQADTNIAERQLYLDH